MRRSGSASCSQWEACRLERYCFNIAIRLADMDIEPESLVLSKLRRRTRQHVSVIKVPILDLTTSNVGDKVANEEQRVC